MITPNNPVYRMLRKQDLQLRFGATLFCFHVVSSLSAPIQSFIFLSFFIVHALYLTLDIGMLCDSISIFWLSRDTRNIREGLVDTSLALVQTIMSVFLAGTLFSQGLLLSGVLSSHVFPVVFQSYQLLVDNVYRSGYMYALIFVRNQLASGKMNFLSTHLTSPDSGYLCGFAFVFLSLMLDYPVLASCFSIPFVALSMYYILDILSYSTNNQAVCPDNNYFSLVIVGLSHCASFVAWAIVLKASLCLSMGIMPAAMSAHVWQYLPEFLLMKSANISANFIVSASVLAVASEVIRSRIYAGIEFDPRGKLAVKQAVVLLHRNPDSSYAFHRASAVKNRSRDPALKAHSGTPGRNARY